MPVTGRLRLTGRASCFDKNGPHTIIYNDIKECSENYTKDCYVAKLDLQGFFMSINKEMLYNMLDKFIVDKYKGEDVETLRYLCKTVILHKPECNCERRSSIELWNNLPPNKSLFTNGEGLGIAIGNLFAQLFANFLLNVLDWYLLSSSYKCNFLVQD